MQIESLDTLTEYVQSADKVNARRAIISYGNKREEKGITEAWDKAIKLIRWSGNRKQKQLKNLILDYEDSTGSVDLLQVIYFVAAIEDELKSTMQSSESREVRKFAEDIFDFIQNKIGNIKVDRRYLQSKKLDL